MLAAAAPARRGTRPYAHSSFVFMMITEKAWAAEGGEGGERRAELGVLVLGW